MDTRFFGPPGWQLLHLIAFRSPDPAEFLLGIKDVLPCKYCRASTTDFTAKMPVCKDPGRWLYDMHNMVNKKLRDQAKEDPAVIDPGENPTFEEVKARYDRMKLTAVPGRDFLFSIAVNYPDKPDSVQIAVQSIFWKRLANVYPFDELREIVRSYPPPKLDSRKSYMKWTYGLLARLSKKVRVPIMSYNAYVQHVSQYKSGCGKKTYRGKTCRKSGGRRTRKHKLYENLL